MSHRNRMGGAGALRRPRHAVAGLLALAACGAAVAGCGGSDKGSSGQAGTAPAKGCKPAHEFKTVSAGKLTVAFGPALPYIEVKDGKLTGVDGDVLEAIAARECLTIVRKPFAGSAGALQTLQSGRADLLAGGWYRTPERAKVLGQTVPVYYDFTAFVSKDGINSLDEVKGKNVALEQGTLFAEPLGKVLGADHVKLFQSADGAFQDVANGQSRAAVMGSGQAGYRLSQKPGLKLEIEAAKPDPAFPPSQAVNEVNFLHSKSNTALTQALDADIEALRGDGTVQKSLERWGLSAPVNFTGKAS